MIITQNLTYRMARPDDDEQMVALRNRMNPEWPPMSLEEYQFHFDPNNSPAGTVTERVVAECDGNVVGSGLLHTRTWTSAPNTYRLVVSIDPDHQRVGIGSRIYERLFGRAQELGAVRLHADVREDRPHALEFARRRGFEPTGHGGRESRLLVRDANLVGYESLDADLARQGIKIVSLREFGLDEDSLHAVYELDRLTAKDIPAPDEITPVAFGLWRKDIIEAPGRSPDQVWLAMHNSTPVAAAYMERLGASAAGNGYTCTHPGYRGRGLARALKLHTIKWAQDEGIEAIYTSNDLNNGRMLEINIRLGYKPLPSFISLAKDMSESASR